MHVKSRLKKFAPALLSCLVLSCARLPASAQTEAPTSPQRTVTLNIHPLPVETLLRLVFSATNAKYTIDPDVQGYIVINIGPDGTLDEAIQRICAKAYPPLSYDFISGVYHVHLKHIPTSYLPALPAPTITPASAPLTIPPPVPIPLASLPQQHVTFQCNRSLRDALKMLFAQASIPCTIGNNIHGTVNADFSDVSFAIAFKSLLTAANPPLQYETSQSHAAPVSYHIFSSQPTLK